MGPTGWPIPRSPPDGLMATAPPMSALASASDVVTGVDSTSWHFVKLFRSLGARQNANGSASVQFEAIGRIFGYDDHGGGTFTDGAAVQQCQCPGNRAILEYLFQCRLREVRNAPAV